TALGILCNSYSLLIFFFISSGPHPALPSFPTRRSSDLRNCFGVPSLFEVTGAVCHGVAGRSECLHAFEHPPAIVDLTAAGQREPDRKSTRLNSSHDQISYAVFCLKKKKDEVI